MELKNVRNEEMVEIIEPALHMEWAKFPQSGKDEKRKKSCQEKELPTNPTLKNRKQYNVIDIVYKEWLNVAIIQQ